MSPILVWWAGFAGGVALVGIAWLASKRTTQSYWRRRWRRTRPALPPVTARAIQRAAQANRAQIREFVRHPPRWVSPASGNFDQEDTEP